MQQLFGCRRARIIAAGLACLGLTGCFDIEQDLTLKSSGAGVFEVSLRIDPAFKGTLETETILGTQKAPVEVTREVRDGQYVQDERVTFNALSELRLPNGTLAVVNNGSTFFGIGPKKLTLMRSIENTGADPGSASVMSSAFANRALTIKMILPGWIDKAYPLLTAGQSIAPKVNGSTVEWQIPMALALASPQLVYKIDFFAYMDIQGNVTAEQAAGDFNSLAPGVLKP